MMFASTLPATTLCCAVHRKCFIAPLQTWCALPWTPGPAPLRHPELTDAPCDSTSRLPAAPSQRNARASTPRARQGCSPPSRTRAFVRDTAETAQGRARRQRSMPYANPLLQ